ncbi:MAG: hypothetical protein CVU39_22605 [Chloroflexi bacterium HGW-Chloroflexi-10]|nr:MAG: hypothetical protein CVU39_22605 [Chloroflexi bacterium HGW-Chloroflexi-10]
MNALLKLTWIDFKLFFRSAIVIFFTFAFPILNIVLFGSMYGSDPTPVYNGHTVIDIMVPGYIAALIIGTTAFMNLPLEIAARRQTGVLRRFRATPLHPVAVTGSQVFVNLFTAVISSIILLVTGMLIFNAHAPVISWQLVFAFLLSSLSLYALSLLIANFFKNVAAARAVMMALFFPMMFISGGTLPMKYLPESIQTASKFLPLTYVVNLFNGAYLDQTLDTTALIVLAAILLVCGILSVRFFRWE